MRISESRIRQIIRQEARRALREGTSTDGALEISNVAWDVVYNDPEMGSQQGNVVFNFKFGKGADGAPIVEVENFEVSVVSFMTREKDLLESITERIVEKIQDNLIDDEREDIELPAGIEAEEWVRAALGPDLKKIMDSLEESERQYQQLAGGGGGGGWY
jgi:hypothetical protein